MIVEMLETLSFSFFIVNMFSNSFLTTSGLKYSTVNSSLFDVFIIASFPSLASLFKESGSSKI